MKLLFDENLSPRLVRAFANEFPDSSHVTTHGYTVISKDDDFRSMSSVNGAPPKVIWMRFGNAAKTDIEKFVRLSLLWIKTFELSPEESLLIL